MVASKPKTPRRSPAVAQFVAALIRPQNRGLVLTALVLAVAIGGAVYAWQRWGQPAMHAADYVVTPEQISVSPPPAWIRADVKAEALRSAAISRLDLRDRGLVERVAGAFALHPWVAKVVRVEKSHPARVRVELEYRLPVAAVEVADRGEAGLVFIDERSVILPSHDFAPGQGKDFLRIAGGQETTAGVYGTPWGSERIAGAARLAALWGQRWQPLELYRIDTTQPPGGELVYELKTRRGVRVIWGTMPGTESARDVSAEQKIAALEHYVHDKGPLEREGGPAVVDLRELAGAAAKTARKPYGAGANTDPQDGQPTNPAGRAIQRN
jgi:hypothetical protein